MTKGYYTRLPNRAAITVTGPDAPDFLQGLITQDIHVLAPGRTAYSALLTPQGKYDFDFFLSQLADGILLECEAARADDLVKTLNKFKLRKNIAIASMPIDVFAFWGHDMLSSRLDPRDEKLGFRFLSINVKTFNGFEKTDFDAYDRHRLALGIPDGSRDFARGEDTVSDMNLENLHGVSFTKGCYMGQELTSRMHHRALSKKGLYPVRVAGTPLPAFSDIRVDGQIIGQMRSSCGNTGLAMLRHDLLPLAAQAGLTPATT